MKTIYLFLFCLLPLHAAPTNKPHKRVLIAGEPFHHDLVKNLPAELAQEAQVVTKTLGSTAEVLAQCNAHFKDQNWDVVCINFGNADFIHRDPNSKQLRYMSRHVGGVKTTSTKQFENNLTEIIKHLKATRAKVIWLTTPPIGESSQLHVPGSELETNAISTRIMAENKIPVIDIHALVKTHSGNRGISRAAMAEIQKPITELIRKALRAR